MKNRITQKGFTLIELLVVIAIIGLLATIAAVALNNARTSSRDTKRLADVKQIQTGLELFFNEANTYPYDAGANVCGGTAPVLVSAIDTTCDDFTTTDLVKYIGGLVSIKDPSNADACIDATNEIDCSYSYADGGATNGSTYTILFYLEQPAGGLPAGSVKATPSGMVAN